jgi:glycosyltransferase involved in cell wall biosynthesis
MAERLTFTIPVSTQPHEQVRAALESALAQDVGGTRVVLVDDAPRDLGYEALAASFPASAVTYRRNLGEHGIGAAWNACIDAADSEFVTILHADDQLMPNYARVMLDLADRHPDASLYFCGAAIVDDAGRPTFSMADFVKTFIQAPERETRVAGEDGITRLLVGNFIMCPTVMYRRARIGARRFSTSLRFVLDLAYLTDALFEGDVIYGTRTTCYRYRRHAGAATSEYIRTGYRFEEEIAIHRALAARAEAIGMRKAASAARFMLFVRLNILYTALADAVHGRWGAAGAKMSQLAKSLR